MTRHGAFLRFDGGDLHLSTGQRHQPVSVRFRLVHFDQSQVELLGSVVG